MTIPRAARIQSAEASSRRSRSKDSLRLWLRLVIVSGPITFLVVGLLGGYTTFSAFSLETLVLLRSGQAMTALINVFLQVTVGVAAATAGFAAARAF